MTVRHEVRVKGDDVLEISIDGNSRFIPVLMWVDFEWTKCQLPAIAPLDIGVTVGGGQKIWYAQATVAFRRESFLPDGRPRLGYPIYGLNYKRPMETAKGEELISTPVCWWDILCPPEERSRHNRKSRRKKDARM